MAGAPVDDERRQDALERAFRFIARRERTVAQVAARLERDQIDPQLINAVIAQLVADDYLSDERYATLFAEDRRALDGWGNERIITHLQDAGISREMIDSVVGSHGHHEQVDDAVRVLDQRIGTKPNDDRQRERALGMLARRGYSLEIAYDAVRAYERG